MKGIQEGMTAAQVSETIMGNFSEVSAEADRAKTMAAAEEARAKGAEQGLAEAVAQNAGEIIDLKDNSATKAELNAEAERAQSAEGEIRGSVESLGEDLNAASEDISKLETALEAEKSRAKGAEQALSTEITEAENRVDERVTEVRDSLEAEVQARSAAVADLEANTGISEYAAFDPAKDYTVGDVVKYEERLYRFTAEHTAGEWIGTDVENWSERKEGLSHQVRWEKGGILTTNGKDNDGLDQRIRTNFLAIKDFPQIIVNETILDVYIFGYTKNKEYLEFKNISLSGIMDVSEIFENEEVSEYRLMIKDYIYNSHKYKGIIYAKRYDSVYTKCKKFTEQEIDKGNVIDKAVNESVIINSGGYFLENSVRGYAEGEMAASMVKEIYIENSDEDLSGELRILLVRVYDGDSVTNTRFVIGLSNTAFIYDINLGTEIPTGVQYYQISKGTGETLHIIIDWDKYISDTKAMSNRCIMTDRIYKIEYSPYIAGLLQKNTLETEIKSVETDIKSIKTGIYGEKEPPTMEAVNLNVNTGYMSASAEGTRYGSVTYYDIENDTYLIESSSNGVIFYYDEDKEFISNSGVWTDLTRFKVTKNDAENAKYFRFALTEVPTEFKFERFLNGEEPLVRKIENLWDLKRTKVFVVVDASGNGDYTTIEDALNGINDSVDNPVTILVMPGVYYPAPKKGLDNIPYNENNRYVSIIGVNRDTCILKGDVGYYYYQINVDYAVLRLNGQVLIKNLTIDSSSERYEEVATENGWDLTSPHCRAYCIHVDGQRAEGSTVEINNCKLINDHFTTVGFGLRKNALLKIENCEMISDVSEEKNTQSGFSTYGTLYGHLQAGTEGLNQNLEVIRCRIRNTNHTQAINLLDGSNGNYGAISSKVTLIGNVCRTTDTENSFKKMIKEDNPQIYELDDMCYGNNVEAMNYNEVV